MKKKALALLLTLALCVGLMVPVSAADASGLDTAAALAYYNVLTKQIQGNSTIETVMGHGIRDKLEGSGVAYAGLEDLNADGKPELVILSISSVDWCLLLSVWTIKNGTAVEVYSDAHSSGAYEGRVAFARKNGQTRLFYEYAADFKTFETREIAMIDGNGNAVRNTYTNSGDGNCAAPEDVTYDKTWIVDSTPILKIENSLQWSYSDSQPQAVKNMQSSLLARAKSVNTAPGTYGPYVLSGKAYDGTDYSISFSAAKVEEKTIQLREHYDVDDSYSAYGNTKVTMITIRPDTVVSVLKGTTEFKTEAGGHVVPVSIGHSDGNSKFTEAVFGVPQYIQDGTGKKSFAWDLEPDFVLLGGGYMIYEEPAVNSQGGFTDVKAGAYYADAVNWAVDKKITSGTTAATFSPNNTCTVGQILTFLWRANGSPAVSGRNPFSDAPSDSYYYKAALWANSKGLVSGGRLNPNAPCTRSMVVTYLWKLSGSPSVKGTAGFTDVPAGAAYGQAVAWAVRQGITSGATETTFNPNGTCTRGQIVTFLYRAMK